MSYILDALQHREAQDNPQAAVQMVIKRHKEQRIKALWLVAAAALLANVGVVIWLLLPMTQAPSSPTSPTAPAPVQAPVTPAPQAPSDAAAPTAAAEQPAQAPPPRKIRTSLERLPASTRARFPGLAFSTHIYADDPSLRAVVVNGRRLTEGDATAGATLEHVTATGVVMEFENYLVEIPVIDDWQ